MATLKRIYVYDEKTGLAVPTQYAEDGQGLTKFVDGDPGKPATVAQVQRVGCNCITSKEYATMYQNGNLPLGVKLAETPVGNAQLFRSEAGQVPGNLQQFFFVLTNNDSAARSVLLGDPTGLIAQQLNVAAKDADLVVTGSYGSSTYDILKLVAGYAPLDLHTLYITSLTTSGATDTSFFAQSSISFVMANVAGNNAQKNTYNIKKLMVDQFNANVRNDDSFRFQLNGLTGILVENIPPGVAVTFTMQVAAYANVAGMVQM